MTCHFVGFVSFGLYQLALVIRWLVKLWAVKLVGRIGAAHPRLCLWDSLRASWHIENNSNNGCIDSRIDEGRSKMRNAI